MHFKHVQILRSAIASRGLYNLCKLPIAIAWNKRVVAFSRSGMLGTVKLQMCSAFMSMPFYFFKGETCSHRDHFTRLISTGAS